MASRSGAPTADGEFPQRPSAPSAAVIEATILGQFRALDDESLELLRRVAAIAQSLDLPVYWVGGGVRDLWLGERSLDFDLVVEGEIAPLAERLASVLEGVASAHPRFLTAEVRSRDGRRIDLAQARREHYDHPGALPRVAPADIEADSRRRDFTINCLAIPLAPSFGDRLLDFHGGVSDLARRQLRTLHRASFEDDPTRLLRAVDFAVRFDFELEASTARDFAAAVAKAAPADLSAERLRAVLERIWGRPGTARAAVSTMVDMGLFEGCGLANASPTAEFPRRLERALAALRAIAQRPTAGSFRLVLLGLALDCRAEGRRELAGQLGLGALDGELVFAGPDRVLAAASGLAAAPSRSGAHELLGPLLPEELAWVAAAGGAAPGWVSTELTELRPMRLRISGRDLLAAGLSPGPWVGYALARTLAARHDLEISANEELDFALAAARREEAGRT